MKRLLITQYGSEEVTYSRVFVVEVPDDTDENKLDDGVLGALADEAGLRWESEDSAGIDSLIMGSRKNSTDRSAPDVPLLSYKEMADGPVV